MPSPALSTRPRRNTTRLAAAFLLTLAGISAGIGLSAVPAFAVDNGQVGIHPSNEPDYFHINLAPGAAINETAIISNHTAAPVTLLTYPVDGLTTPQGGFSLAAQSSTAKNVGTWTHVASKQVTVPARSDLRVPFQVTVPTSASPGDYYGGLIIQSPPKTGKTVSVNGTAVQLNVVQREGVRIYLTVAGTRHYRLETGTLNWNDTSSGVDFSVPVTNQGNTILHPHATMTVNSTIGANTKLTFNTPESLLPGDSLTLHAHLPRMPLLQVGKAQAKMHSEAGTQHRNTSFTSLPWVGIAIATLLTAALIFAGTRFTRFLRRARAALAATAGTAPQPDQTTGTRRTRRH